MDERGGLDAVESVRKRLERWRSEHGGRGRRIPEALWLDAVELALRDGVDATARALRLNAGSLERRLAQRDAEMPARFVELAGTDFSLPRVNRVELTNRSGTRMRIELGADIDVVALIRAFTRP